MLSEVREKSESFEGFFGGTKYFFKTYAGTKSKYIKRVHSVKIQRHTDSRANVVTRHQKQH